MTGIFIKKYHIAVLDESENDSGFKQTITNFFKTEYTQTKVKIEKFSDTYEMFKSININESNNNPFDLIIMTQQQKIHELILHHSNPSVSVILFEDEKTLKKQVDTIIR